MRNRLFTAAIAAALALPALAHAHGPSSPVERHSMASAAQDPVPDRVQRALGGEVSLRANGLYRVEMPSGVHFRSHGPDSRDEMLTDTDGDGAVDLSTGPERAPFCVPSPASDYHQRVLYGYPSTGANNLAAHLADLQAQIRRNNWLINDQSLAAGGPEADFKVRCDGAGQIDITAFPVNPDLAGTNASFGRIVSAAQAAGFTGPRVDYTIFYDGNGPACGVGYFYSDESPGIDNRNNNPPSTGAGYGAAYKACWFGRTSIHENAHNEGAAQYNAPHSTGSGAHCDESYDILCYVDGGDKGQVPVECPLGPPAVGTYYYDCSWDTYFDSAPESGEWLSDHWNIGSTVNRFIRFGADTRVPETTILSGPTGTVAAASFSFAASEEPATFDCSLVAPGSPPSFEACASPKAYSGIPDGPYEFSVRSRDTAGNTDQTPATRTLIIDAPGVVSDASAPDTTLTGRPANVVRGKRAKTTVRFSFASSEPGAQFECRLDEGVFSGCASPRRYRVSRGKHSFAVRSVDASGNTDPTPATDSFKVKRKRKHR
jgi:hypothetical protein